MSCLFYAKGSVLAPPRFSNFNFLSQRRQHILECFRNFLNLTLEHVWKYVLKFYFIRKSWSRQSSFSFLLPNHSPLVKFSKCCSESATMWKKVLFFFFFSKISFVLLFTTWIFDIFVDREFLLENIAYQMVATSYARNTWALVGATISLLLIQTPRGNIVFVFRAGGGGVYSENGMQTTTSVRNLVEVLRCQTPYCLSHYEYFCLFFFFLFGFTNLRFSSTNIYVCTHTW